MRHRRASRAALCHAAILVGFVAGFAPLALHGQERTPVAESAPTAKFVTVCADAGAGGYEAFPDVCRTTSGELLCVFYAGYGHVSDPSAKLPRGARIALCRCRDDGRTWSPAETVVDTPIDDRDPSIVALPNGELLVTFMTYDTSRKSGTHQVFSVRSADDGRTWSPPEPIPTPFTQLEAISTPPRLMPDGRLLLTPYGNNTGDPRSYKHAAVLESRDLGRTWRTLAEVKSSPADTCCWSRTSSVCPTTGCWSDAADDDLDANRPTAGGRGASRGIWAFRAIVPTCS